MKVWYVVLVGRPNSGKSTILNACVEESLAPVSRVPNTTRHSLLGIYSTEQAQILFLDSPGFQVRDDLMGKYLRKETVDTLRKADVIVRVRDVSREYGEEDVLIDERLKGCNVPVIQIYTKTDLKRVQQIPADELTTSRENIPAQALRELIIRHLPEWVPLFEEDVYTDVPVYERIAEIIREQANLHLHEEIPHALYVHVEDVDFTERGIRILAYIVVEKESQKRIVIGKWGDVLKKIWIESRKRMMDIYEQPVHLFLRVRVEPNWTKNPRVLNAIFSSNA